MTKDHVVVVTQLVVPTEMALGPMTRDEATEWSNSALLSDPDRKKYLRVQVFKMVTP